MNNAFKKQGAVIVLLLLGTIVIHTGAEAVTRFSAATAEKKTPAAFAFDDIWFFRGESKIIPDVNMSWLTVVFDPRYSSYGNEFETTYDSFIQEKAKAFLTAYNNLIDFFYDQNLAEDACFFKLREGLSRDDLRTLINQLNQEEAVEYTHPTITISNKTYAFFNLFQLQWKTGADKAHRESLLRQTFTAYDEKESIYRVDLFEIAFFKAVNLLTEDIRVLKTEPYLLELKPSIMTQLTLTMNGGNIGDSIPFTLRIAFSDRVNIDPSSIANINLRPANLQKELFDCSFDAYDYSKAVMQSPIMISGRMKFFAPGEYLIPSLSINYTCPACSGKILRTVATKPVWFKVSTIIPSVKAENNLIVPTDPVPPKYDAAVLHRQALLHAWFAGVAILVCLLCGAWFIALFYRRKAERERLQVRRQEDLLKERLLLLLNASTAAPHWSYLSDVSVLLRKYIVARYGIKLKYNGGSGKQFLSSVKERIPRESVDSLAIIFNTVDTIVALELAHYQDIEQLKNDIMQIITPTAPET